MKNARHSVEEKNEKEDKCLRVKYLQAFIIRGMKMHIYTYISPVYVGSKKVIDILNEENQVVGHFQRYDRNFWQNGLNKLFAGDFFVNVKGRDAKGNIVVDIQEDYHWKAWLRSTWRGHSETLGPIQLKDRSKIRTHPRMELHTETGEVFYLSKDMTNRSVLIKDAHGEMIADIRYLQILPSKTIQIQLYSETWSVCDVAVLYFLFTMKY